MGNRLSKIYTRTGDDGTTGLGDGQRVTKDSVRVAAYGDVDELNSAIGVVLATGEADEVTTDGLINVQSRLFDLGGELCIPGTEIVTAEFVTDLETLLDQLNADLPPLKDFVLPGGTRAAAACHLARTICRRAERSVWSLARSEDVNEYSLKFLNRLSDLLFVIARHLNRRAGRSEPLWQRSDQD